VLVHGDILMEVGSSCGKKSNFFFFLEKGEVHQIRDILLLYLPYIYYPFFFFKSSTWKNINEHYKKLNNLPLAFRHVYGHCTRGEQSATCSTHVRSGCN